MPKAAQHRDNIVKSAIRLFRRDGYAATGLNDILKSSKAPKGSLYYYFPGGKEELGTEAVTMAGKTVTNTLKSLEEETTTASEFFDRYTALLAYWVEKSGFSEGCPITTTLLETAHTSAPIATAGASAFDTWHSILTRILMRDGQNETDAKENATLLLSNIQGALLLSRVQKTTDAIKAVSLLAGKLLTPETVAPL